MKIILSPLKFSDLKQNLELCDDLFLNHQFQLMHNNIERALHIFEQLAFIRRIHLAVMEEVLLPSFINTVVKIPAGAKVLYFEREKKQIMKYLDKYSRVLGNILLHSSEIDIVSLFEDYAWFKDLLDHHDAREKAFLFPTLEKIAQDKKQQILNEISIRLKVLEQELQ